MYSHTTLYLDANRLLGAIHHPTPASQLASQSASHTCCAAGTSTPTAATQASRRTATGSLMTCPPPSALMAPQSTAPAGSPSPTPALRTPASMWCPGGGGVAGCCGLVQADACDACDAMAQHAADLAKHAAAAKTCMWCSARLAHPAPRYCLSCPPTPAPAPLQARRPGLHRR
jgi:hypothetical protein